MNRVIFLNYREKEKRNTIIYNARYVADLKGDELIPKLSMNLLKRELIGEI